MHTHLGKADLDSSSRSRIIYRATMTSEEHREKPSRNLATNSRSNSISTRPVMSYGTSLTT